MSWLSRRFHAAEHAVGSAAHAVAHAASTVARPAERLAHAALSPVLLATEAPLSAAAWAVHRATGARWAGRAEGALHHELGQTEHQAAVVGSIGAAVGVGIATLNPAAAVKGATSAAQLVAAAVAPPTAVHPAVPPAAPPAAALPAAPPAAPAASSPRAGLVARLWHYFMTREWTP